LVGARTQNKISPGNPIKKPDGTIVRTLWGELAWQLGGKKAFAQLAADDEKATSPGDVLRKLFNEYGPCLILIDEWVAYARQLHDQSDLPAGGFETQFSFAQALTESAKAAKNCLLVISLPASDTAGSPHTQADDVEVGGQRGREALNRLRNVVGRVESSWRPASAEEGFEIVRRRLFEPLADPAQFKDRDVVARAFTDFYRTQQQEFPPECREADYEKRIKAAYPIHPEIFDRLYTDWSTLVKFQRTRGVLRLMAAVIHSLWEKGDRNPLILPANISIDDPVVLGIDQAYMRESGSAGEAAARAILEARGNAPRLYRNTLTFLAADKTRLQDLDEAARRYIAWDSILAEKAELNLDHQQEKQAETQKTAADSAVTARLPETYQWLLVPVQSSPQPAVEWQSLRLSGQDALAVRASKKLRSDESLVTGFGATRLRMELDRIPLWRSDYVEIKKLVEDFARYLYLPRLKDSAVLLEAIREGLRLLTWSQDSFAYADSFDDAAGRFRGLRCGQMVNISADNLSGVLVRPEVALKQLQAETAPSPSGPVGPGGPVGGPVEAVPTGGASGAPGEHKSHRPKRFHGSVSLDPARVGRDAGRVADEVISHLAGLVGSSVKVTLDIEATIETGAPENVVRTVTENSRTLKFTTQGFEEE
jgi:predicted AAA+ superfamily ATPase